MTRFVAVASTTGSWAGLPGLSSKRLAEETGHGTRQAGRDAVQRRRRSRRESSFTCGWTGATGLCRCRWTRQSHPSDSRQFLRQSGGPLQRSLFDSVYESELNQDEQDVAVYLDGESAVTWWHRNVARTQYGIQGWKKLRIYPDFIFAVRGDGDPGRIVILETKGDYLDNLDTAYKREVLSFLSRNFTWDDSTRAGDLELVVDDGQIVQCALILMSEWQTKLPHLLDPGSG